MTKVKIKQTEFGRGLFATKNMRKDELVERSPVLLISADEYLRTSDTILRFYVFKWTNTNEALALGIGSLFNHSRTPNVTYEIDKLNNRMIFRTTRAVKKGEQLFINYGYNPVIARQEFEALKRQKGWS